MEDIVKRNIGIFLLLFILGFLGGTFIPIIAHNLTGLVTLGYCPDVNGNGIVNIQDTYLVATAINQTNCDSYDCDLDNDGIVTEEDAKLVAINNGKYAYDITDCAAVFHYGALKITTNPSGSGTTVYMDDASLASTTPVTLNNVAAGTHTIKIVKSGYSDYVTTLNVQEGQLNELNADLNAQQIACSVDLDCGAGGAASPAFCSNDDLYQLYVYSKCINPGTTSSYCGQGNETKLVQDCAYGCSNGACNQVSQNLSCHTLGTTMYYSSANAYYIGCDIKIDTGKNDFDLSKSYCVGSVTGKSAYLKPDGYGRADQYYATLTGLAANDVVSVYVWSTSQNKAVECLPRLNNQPVSAKCSDSDLGKNYSAKGTCKDNSGSYTDSCIGAAVRERFCQNDACVFEDVACQNGCSDGMCNPLYPILYSCNDTDGNGPGYSFSYNLYVKGTASGYKNGVPYSNTDYCNDSNKLMEYYCSGINMYSYQTACSYGCSNGACNATPLYNPTCTDSDNGINNLTAGFVSGINSQGVSYRYDDTCTGNYLTEQYCSANGAVVKPIFCPYGCSGGKCSQAPQNQTNQTTPFCTDSDGRNYHKAGKCTDAGGNQYMTDACGSSTLLREAYCNPSLSCTFEWPTCPDGCVDGACICKGPYMVISSDGYCAYSCSEGTTPDNNSSQCICKSGYVETGTDQLGRRICTTLANLSCHTLGTTMYYSSANAYYIGCDIKIDTGKNDFDLSKSYCVGSVTGKSAYLKPDGYGRADQYYATLTGLAANDVVSVYAWSTSQNKAVECLPKLNQQSVQPTCTDTEGGIYPSVYGVISGISNGTPFRYPDVCSGNYLDDYYCYQNNPSYIHSYCQNGCFNGTCIPSISCTDSDGGLNYNSLGYTYGINTSRGSYIILDDCSGSNVLERYCLNNLSFTTSYTCPYGCAAGKCNQATTTCKDSDGTNYYTYGYINITNVSGTSSYYDSCSYDNVYVKEMSCSNNQLSMQTAYCQYGCSGGKCLSSPPVVICIDSDGINYNVYGYVNITNISGTITYYDSCSYGDSYVKEAYCTNNYWAYQTSYCPYGCSGGKCSQTPQNQTNTSCVDDDQDGYSAYMRILGGTKIYRNNRFRLRTTCSDRYLILQSLTNSSTESKISVKDMSPGGTTMDWSWSRVTGMGTLTYDGCTSTFYVNSVGSSIQDGYITSPNAVTADGNTYCSAGNDCEDNNVNINPGKAEICNNGIDDNCNRQIDENCLECSDITCDGTIDNTDVAIMQDVWNKAVSYCVICDIDRDNDIDIVDVQKVSGRYGTYTDCYKKLNSCCISGCPDINCDGFVDNTDLSIVNKYWHNTSEACLMCDINKDGYIDIVDVQSVAGNINRTDGEIDLCKRITTVQLTNEITVSDSCADSDNGNVTGLKGSTYGYLNNLSYEKTDSCLNTQILIENYCAGSRAFSYQTTCNYGCSDGACKAAPQDSCNDTDFYNPYYYSPYSYNTNVKGTASGYKTGVPYSNTDYCIDGNKLMEFYCSGINSYSKETECPYGCSNGACFTTNPGGCNETDNGEDIYTKGTTRTIIKAVPYSYEDVCSSDTLLTEYYCENGLVYTWPQMCTYGCSNGACLKSIPGSECNDTDTGYDLYAKGTVSALVNWSSYAATDICISPTQLTENYCSLGKPYAWNTTCWYGCYDGACSRTLRDPSQITCTDSDGGINYNLKGSVTYKWFATTYNYTDYCYTNNAALAEYYCDNIYARISTKTCTCSNGRCVPKTIISPCDSYGDVDSDGYVTQEDANIVSNYVVGFLNLTDEQKTRADVNGDAKVTMVDAMLIAQYANGIITTFNVCSGPEICDGIDNDHDGQIDEGLSGCPSLFVEEKPLVVAEERYVCSLHNKTSGNGAFIKGQDGGTSITVGNMSYFPFGDTIYKDNPTTIPNIPNNIAYTNDPDASDCIFLNHKKTSGPETFFSTSDGSGNLVWSGYTPSSSGGVYQFFASDISCTDSSCFETAAEITYVSLVNLSSNYNYNLYICNPACSEDSNKEILPATTDSSGVLTWSGTSPKSSGGKYQVFAADPSKNCNSSPCIEKSSLLRRIDLKNLLADRNYKFTICNPNCTRDVPGKARSLFTAITGPPYNEITAWPGGMFSIEDGAVHFYYASVISWPEGPPGWQWKVQGVGLAKFNLSTLESKRIGTLLWDNSKPNVSVGAADAPIFVDNYLYVFIGIMPARVPKNQVENIDSYEYWTGGSWSKNISQGVPLWNEPTGTNSISIKYNSYLKKWLAMYGADYLTSVAVRTADQLTGPWSERVILLNCSKYQAGWPTCYTIWNHDQYSKNNGQTIYLVYSNIQDYRVFLHEAKLAIPIYEWRNYSNTVMYKKKGSSAPSGFTNYGPVFYALEYSSSSFSPVYEWHDTLAGRYRYSNSNPGASYTNEGTAFYAPLSQLTNYSQVYRWEKGITDIYSAKSGLESLGFTQKELAFYAKVS